ncbi:DUF6009 family protein [Streptomyces sp. RK75]|uniref:DUF6009 family protein n=1 Tax=Streptomyces sp. RK75 TaxID=2824895 RepID=UPI000C19CCD3|nr:DUF6009 family protein [Streptomyces sp. RK75]MBQ0867334.1 transcription factor [Streptomyces sp. RK75]
MSALIDPKDLAHEEELVWLENTEDLDYVRQTLDRVSSRRRQPPYHRDGRLVGYATLTRDAKPSRASGTWLRRVFWLAPHDRDQDPDGLYATGAPSEAVDPRTLKPTIKGYKTERSEGGPASDAMREMGIELPKV